MVQKPKRSLTAGLNYQQAGTLQAGLATHLHPDALMQCQHKASPGRGSHLPQPLEEEKAARAPRYGVVGDEAKGPEAALLEHSNDPLARAFALSPLAATCPEAASERFVPTPLAPELVRLLRRIAWGGDRARSVAYLEIGAGELAGASLTIESQSGQVSLSLELPPGVSSRGWEQRLCSRLERRGINVASVLVR